MESEILGNLHPALSIAWDETGEYAKPAPREDIQVLLAAFPGMPPDYLDIARQYEVLSFTTVPDFQPSFRFFLLSPADILGWLEWYPYLQESMPGAFFFASDGDMSFLVAEHDGQRGVFKVETSAADWKSAEYLAPSIRAVLCDGVGWAEETV